MKSFNFYDAVTALLLVGLISGVGRFANLSIFWVLAPWIAEVLHRYAASYLKYSAFGHGLNLKIRLWIARFNARRAARNSAREIRSAAGRR